MNPLRLRSLIIKHATLEDRLAEELRLPRPNDVIIKQIKKLKLQLRDQINLLSPAGKVAA